MRIPGAENSVVPEEKIVYYLLNEDHPDGASKSRFLHLAGFARTRPYELQRALKNHVLSHDAREGRKSPFGRKYEVAGPLIGPTGSVMVLSVWIILHGESVPRLITIIPE
ncbi:MAG: DUF6883 domain-containing protein [Pirellulales bacterium]